jgi:hypothetical protein
MATVTAALGAAGCMTLGLAAAPTVGAPGYVYQAGRASQAFIFPIEQVQGAVLESMADLEFHDVHELHEATRVTFQGKAVDGRHATVTIDSQNSVPVVSVRIGWLGDEPLSKALMDRIGIRLGTLPPSAIPAEPPSSPTTTSSLISRPKSRNPEMLPIQGAIGYRDTPIP